MISVCFFFGGKNARGILKLLVREIELSEHVETCPRLRTVCFMAIRWAIMCDTLYFSPVGRHFPEPPISLVLRVGLSGHFLHYTHFVKSSRPPVLDLLLKFLRWITYLCQFRANLYAVSPKFLRRIRAFASLGPIYALRQQNANRSPRTG